MKKLLYLAIPALLMTACGEKKYSIEGKTTGEYEGKLALLQNSKGETLDSCIVADSAFAFTGASEGQGIYSWRKPTYRYWYRTEQTLPLT